MTSIDEPLLGNHLPRDRLTGAKDDALARSAAVDDQFPGLARLGVESAQEADFLSAVPLVRLLFVALSNDLGSERIISGMARCGVECAVMSPSHYFCARTRVGETPLLYPRPPRRLARHSVRPPPLGGCNTRMAAATHSTTRRRFRLAFAESCRRPHGQPGASQSPR